MISTRRILLSFFRFSIFGGFVFFLLSSWGTWIQPVAQPLFHQGNHWVESWRFRDAQTLHREHIILYHPEELTLQANQIADEAENVLKFFEQHHQFKINQPVPIFLFPDRDSLSHHFSWSESQSATGVYFSGAIYLLNPEVWDPQLPDLRRHPDLWGKRFHQNGPLYHEMAHFYLDRVTRGNFPRWYTEAYAQWVEYCEIGFEWVVPANRLDRNRLYTFPELEKRFDRLPNQAMAYRQSFLFLRHMIDTAGEDSLNLLHDRLARGTPFNDAWEAVYDRSPEESFTHWVRGIKK